MGSLMHTQNGPKTSREIGGVWKWVICAPNEVLVKSGMGVTDMEWGKKTFLKPFQKVTMFDMNPRNYTFNLNNMSSEMVPFSLPVVFTIGPYDPTLDPDLFMVYARRMGNLTGEELEHIVAGVVHGETRVYTAGLTISEMFQDRTSFRQQVQERIQKDMNHYGMYIYNANIAEMRDLDAQNKYFENLKQKALEGATTEARIQVAEARKLGDIGEKERQGDTTIQIAKVNANVARQQNERQQEMEQSRLQLELVKTQCSAQEQMARVAADYATKQKQAELETSYQLLSAKQQVEQLRASQLSVAMVDAEAAIKRAEGEAEAVQRRADATLYAETKKAEAVLKLRQVQAEGLRLIFDAVGDRPELALQYLMAENGLFDRLAAQTAAAVQGLNPRINVWSNGAGSDADGMAPVAKMLAGLPPMLDVIAQQTDIKLPGWMPQAAAPGGGATAGGKKGVSSSS